MNRQYNWLFGENEGKTANNNSYYLWLYIIRQHYDAVNAVFIAEKNKSNQEIFSQLESKEKKRFIWRNSPRHISLYDKADLLFVSVSFKDVQPDRLSLKSYVPLPTAPMIYLQHGTLAIKRLGYRSYYANNTMLRFLFYNPNIKEKLIEINQFKPYQLLDGGYPPRYCELARRALNQNHKSQKGILWFVTWREYFGDNNATYSFLRKVKSVLMNNQFRQYCRQSDCKVTLCLHRNFTDDHVKIIKEAFSTFNEINIRLVYAQDEDVMGLLTENDVLITDYSSVGFDFTFLNKPVILFQPDLKEYVKHREMYCTVEELRETNIEKTSELIDIIVNEKYGINPFLRLTHLLHRAFRM